MKMTRTLQTLCNSRYNTVYMYVFTADDPEPVDNGKAKKCMTSPLKGLETIAPLVHSVEETPEPISTEVQGTIPSWINGKFLRNGPGKFEFGNTQ